ncbi:uncharacterized protein LOC129810001 [Phlebotomus papatasi]|uniref:uncharacterized protein LOC129810001 n=1 Tax=Phlebotomus papatasi TaxID=29031 RepID=UPI002484359E|nr:uncharacterized protein LOC129810001 [Phlebotomus papatasi]
MSGKPVISMLESCRVCGEGNVEGKGRHFLYGIDQNDELLTILRTVLPIVIYPEDPLSKWICTRCRDKVMAFCGISQQYRKYLGKCLGALRKVDPEETYLQICSDVETFAATLEDSLKEKVPSAAFDRKRLILPGRRGSRVPEKKAERADRAPGVVPSLFEVCIDYINREGRNLLNTFLHVDSARAWSESEVEESESSMSFDDHTEGETFYDTSNVECTVNITEGYSMRQEAAFPQIPPTVTENGVGKKRKLSGRSVEVEPTEKPHTRPKSRVNYSEDMLDEAFFYEQMMLEQYKRRAKTVVKEEPAPVYKQPQVAAKRTHAKSSIGAFPLMDIRQQLKTDPTQVIQFNSELSIHLKARDTPRSPPEIQWEPPNEDVDPVDCKFCRRRFQNMAILSKHQLRHFVLRLKRLDTPEILHPKFRRYSYRYPNFRCCNCLSYYMSKESLKEHWGKGECEFFCRICRASFHRSRQDLHKHYYLVHGIRFNDAIFAISGLEIDESKICSICYCTFPNFQSRNSHMKIHKKKGEVSQQILIPSTSNPAPIPRPRLQINQALQMEIKRMEFASHQRFNGIPSSSRMVAPPFNHRPPPHLLPAPPRFVAPGPLKRFPEVPMQQPPPMGDDEPVPKIYNCIPCGGKFPNKSELYRHKRTCPQLLRTCCHICWKQFTTTSEFESHMRQHHG